jgi:hypothetical protein
MLSKLRSAAAESGPPYIYGAWVRRLQKDGRSGIGWDPRNLRGKLQHLGCVNPPAMSFLGLSVAHNMGIYPSHCPTSNSGIEGGINPALEVIPAAC